MLIHEEVLRNLHVLANLQSQQKLTCHGIRLDVDQSLIQSLTRRISGVDRLTTLEAAEQTCKMGEEIFQSYMNNIYIHCILCHHQHTCRSTLLSPEQLESAQNIINHINEWLELKDGIYSGLDRLTKHADYTADPTFQLKCKQVLNKFKHWFSKCEQFLQRQQVSKNKSKDNHNNNNNNNNNNMEEKMSSCFLIELAHQSFLDKSEDMHTNVSKSTKKMDISASASASASASPSSSPSSVSVSVSDTTAFTDDE